MPKSKTTIAGAVAAVASALQATLPGPGWLHTLLVAISAGALAALGYHAQDGNSPKRTTPSQPPNPTRLPPSILIVLLIGLSVVLLTACACIRAETTRATSPGTTNATETTTLHAWTFFDSGQAIARASARSGYAPTGTWAPGISLTGLEQQSSTTGATAVVKILLQQLAPAAGP